MFSPCVWSKTMTDAFKTWSRQYHVSEIGQNDWTVWKKKQNLDSMLQGLPSSTENQVRETFFSVSKVNTVFWDIFRLFQHFVIIAD